jgi:hypothetical protein
MRTALIFLLLLLVACVQGSVYTPQDGDIVFHTSRSSQSQAIQLATGSQYSHMGIVYVTDDKAYVFEAVQSVKTTPLSDWIKRGEGGHFAAKRLRDSERLLTPEALKKMQAAGEKMRGKNYDLYFEWSDERIYCSELVWKIYHRALGLSIGELETLGDFDLTSPAVQQKISERYSDTPPLGEAVISPASMFNSELLELAHSE